MGGRISAGLSGGVDSSVTAALLLEAGNEVEGVTLRLFGDGSDTPSITSAREVCKALGIPHRVVDLREEFSKRIIDYFIETYTAGLTPNPCVRCNEQIKFGMLMDFAKEYGGGMLATGHYARIGGMGGRLAVMKARDDKKDQSYFLYRLTQGQLSNIAFPLGGMTKDEVRAKARTLGLPTAEREESQEVCFIPDDDYRAFIRAKRPDAVRAGEFVDRTGKALGSHEGIAFYTIGQRKGLGVSSPLGRRYVLDRDAATNRIVLGDEDDLKREDCMVGDVNWMAVAGIDRPTHADVKLRYRSGPTGATLVPEGDKVRVVFDRPEPGVSPGQSAVFYDGDTVLGGGIILKDGG